MAKQNTQIQKNPVAIIKSYLASESVKMRFEEMLGKRAGSFTNSIITLVRNNPALQKCTPESTVSSAVQAASFNLMVDPALGQAAIVPYKSVACFQIMYKGVVQLCIRSGMYATIHCTEIYKDELKSWNAVKGEIEFTDRKEWKLREKANPKDVVGHYAYFKLLAGFEKCDFITVEQALSHAKKYSKAYQYDLKEKKQTSCWSTMPIPMGNKTVLLRLLTKYGVMSVEMQEAYMVDRQSFEEKQDETTKRIDSAAGSEVVDAEFEPQNDNSNQQEETEQTPAEETKTAKGKNPAKKQQQDSIYTCQCGNKFDEPKTSGSGATQVSICPNCLSKNIRLTEEAA